MATRTIANGGGNWNATGTWVEGAIPTAADDVVATGTSGQVTIPAAVTALARSVNLTGYTSTLTFAATTSVLTIGDASGGALTLSSGMTLTLTGVGTINLVSTSNNGGAGWAITTAGKTLPNLTMNGVGGKWVQADALTCSGTITGTRGTLDTANFSMAAVSFSQGSGQAFTLTPGSSTMTFSGTWTNDSALTVTANTALVVLTATNSTFTQAQASTYNGLSVSFTGAGTATLSCQSGTVFANVTRTGTATKTDTFRIANSFTCTGTLTVNSNSAVNRVLVFSSTTGTARTITAAAVVISNVVDFTDITGAGAASWTVAGTGATALGDALGNSGITFTASAPRYAVAPGNWSSTAMWSTASGGASGASVPLPQDDVVLDANSAAGTYTIDMPRLGRNLTCTGFTRTLVTTIASALYGSLVLGSGMAFNASSAITLAGRGSHTVQTNGKSLGSNLIVSTFGGTYDLLDAAAWSAGRGPSLLAGTLNTNGYSVTGASSGVTGSLAATLNLSTSTLSFLGSGGFENYWLVSNTNAVVSAENATIALVGAATTTRTFSGGNRTYGTLTYTVADSPGALAITGANTFGTINVGPGRSLTLPQSTTTAVNNWNVVGEDRAYWRPGNTTGHYASVPDATAVDITGDIDVRARVALDDWTPATIASLVAKRGNSTEISYQMYIATNGLIGLVVSANGTTTSTGFSTVVTGVADGATKWVRATRVAATGVVTFYLSDDGAAWTQLGATAATTAGAVYNSTTSVEFGSHASGGTSILVGNLYRAQILDGIGGTTVLDVDFGAKPVGADTYVCTTGQTVTFTGALAQVGDGRIALASSSAGSQAVLLGTGSTIFSGYLTVKDVAAGIAPPWSLGGTGGNLFTANQSSAETDLTGVTALNSTLTRDTSLAHTGAASFKTVATGTFAGLTMNATAVTPGLLYALRWVPRHVTGTPLPPRVDATFDAGGTPQYLPNNPLLSDVWSPQLFGVVAPVGSSTVAPRFRSNGSSVAGDVVHYDDLGLNATSPAYAGASSVDGGNNTGWLFTDIAVGSQVAARWATRATVGVQRQALWNVAALTAVGLDGLLRWSLTRATAASVATAWSARAATAGSAQTVWSTRARGGASAEVAWDVTTPAGETLTTPWSLTSSTGSSSDVRWSLRAPAGGEAEVPWDTAAVTAVDASARWRVRWGSLRDIAIDVGPPELGWTIGEPALAWTVGPPTL